MYVGKYNGQQVRMNEGMQRSILITGIPGSGKSCRIHQIEQEVVKEGGTVIVVDITPAHVPERIFSGIAPSYEGQSHRIDAIRDGLNCSFLSAFQDEEGTSESEFRITNSVVASLTNKKNGYKQVGVLRDAVMKGIAWKKMFKNMSDVDIIRGILEAQVDAGSLAAESLLQQLWPVFHSGVFRPGNKHLKYGRVNIVDFSGLDIPTAAICAELFLSVLWRSAYFAGFNARAGTVLVVVDECQLLPLRGDSSIGMMLSEGRKFGVNLALITQSTSVLKNEERSVVDMAGTKLYFRPEQSDEKRIQMKLHRIMGERSSHFHSDELRVGEAIAVGPLKCGGYPVNGAILTY